MVAAVDVALAQDGTGPLAIQQIRELGARHACKAPVCVFFIDHAAPAPRSELANAQALIRAFCAETGATLSDVEMGVCHQRVAESYAKPGDLVIGADSHTCTAGALGAFATGMGSTDVAVGMATGSTWLRVPETIRVEVVGPGCADGVDAKDLMLTVIGTLGADGATYKALEFGGPGIEALPMAGRLTLSNMAVEAGAKAGLVASDETTRAFLAAQGREQHWRPLAPDAGAAYERTLPVDLADGRAHRGASAHRGQHGPGRAACRHARGPGAHRHLHQRPPGGPAYRGGAAAWPPSCRAHPPHRHARLARGGAGGRATRACSTCSGRPAPSSPTPAAAPAWASTRASWPTARCA